MQIKTYTLLFGAFCLSLCAVAQDKSSARFGKITPEDFKTDAYKIDTGTSAVIVADIGSSSFESGTDWFIQVYKRYKRIHILNKNGYDEANVSIYLHQEGSREERVSNLKAVTYNLEDGKVVETKLESKGVFTDKYDENTVLKKFTLPAVKEGSIIEFSYTINSEFFSRLRPWAFQDAEHPVLWSEYEITLPEYYEYIFLSQGYHPFHIKDSENSRKNFSFRMAADGPYGSSTGRSETVSVNPGVTRHRWVMKDVAPLKEEGFVTTLSNHVCYIEFQLAAERFPNQPVRNHMNTWPKFMETMMKAEYYGAALDKNNNFMSDEVKTLTAGAATEKEKAEKVFAYVRDNFTCTDYSIRYADQSLKTTFTKKSGSVTEINLVLVAMLRQAGLQAAPVLLSTRNHGKVYALYPIASRFNYTIASVQADGAEYTLDATRPYLGFGKLHASCYNGHARLVTVDAGALAFEADSLREYKVTGIFIAPDEKGVLTGHFQQQPTYFESYDLRAKIKEKGEETYFKDIAKGYSTDINLKNGKIDKLKDYAEPVLVEYDFTLNTDSDNGMIYLHPMFSESLRSNPFKSAVRAYPVEMPAVPDANFTLSIQLPDNYTVEEIPKSTIVKYNDGEGLFQFLVQQTGNMIQLRSRVKLTRANYLPEEYDSLREFYDVIVKKHAEQIVLKKKS
ncbi:DUF3857 domain-containing protein [Chitinophaga lutea]|uniref:DUF3857 domain-containing protein n=1 Tax=Chitinophaga lutea TaxID=2488634 RepID=A0A3N4PGZ9_9BACT|nr:DUF3857 domain-containing protein [Chitinophaga lutea]RPE05819.1 DUF3857 domain-containing protein [Chitinophaga lutea]